MRAPFFAGMPRWHDQETDLGLSFGDLSFTLLGDGCEPKSICAIGSQPTRRNGLINNPTFVIVEGRITDARDDENAKT
jgi:hypothetical protein